MGRLYDCLRDASFSTADGSILRIFSRLLDKADRHSSNYACFKGVLTVQKKAICKPCVAMLYAENGDVNRRAPYLCRFSDCLIAEMKKELDEC